jgi:hypothetical protein
MATVSLPRPDLAAHRNSLMLPMSEIVRVLAEVIGKKLTAYIAGVKDTRAIDRWIEGAQAYNEVEQRLRLAYHVVMTLTPSDSPAVIQAWLTGFNPELADRVPIRLLKEKDIEQFAPLILGAARAFAAGG